MLGRRVLGACAALTLLAGCDGAAHTSAIPLSAAIPPANADAAPMVLPHHKTFYYTGKEQTFTVPAGVSKITVVMRGGAGAGTNGGRAGRVFAVVPVRPGGTLYIYVGGQAADGSGGFNGGGSPGPSSGTGYGGGGASDVREGRDGLGRRILVAGGGGGAGVGNSAGNGGAGGGSVGGAGGGAGSGQSGSGGGGGTQSKGGSGGAGGQGASGENPGQGGSPGVLQSGGTGGQGGNAVSGRSSGGAGGGGGGGFYGGGGGGGGGSGHGSRHGGPGGGGGGGSSYVEPSAITHRTWRGWKNATGNGLVVFSWQ